MAWKTVIRLALGVELIVTLAATAAAGGPHAVGSLVGSRDATLDGQRPLPHTVLLSGDKLRVNDGLAMVTLKQGNRLVMGEKSEASVLREAKALTVMMAHGNLSVYHPPDATGVRIKAGGVTVAPVDGRKTQAEIALADGILVVTAKDGALKVEKDGATSEVAKGHTLTIAIAAAGTAASSLPGNLHQKYGAKHEAHFAAGSSAGGNSAAALALALHHRHHRHVSPIHPGR